MQISLIGGSGFIGSRLAKAIHAKANTIKILDTRQSLNYPNSWQPCDVRDFEELSANIDRESTIVNLAAEHRDDVTPRSLYDEVNVDGARNICEVARRKDCKKIIFTSSVAVYGFAPKGTDENGAINPFNDYGRTKWEAEKLFREWQEEAPNKRTLVIIRPTVVFGENNRGNVYNLLKQIASGKFAMIGNGHNQKSMAYVENVAAFIRHSLSFTPGIHTYNYVDKPDFSMNELLANVHNALGLPEKAKFRLPYALGILAGYCFDILAKVTGKKLPISSIRVKKFCSDTLFDTSIEKTGFKAPVSLGEGLKRTIEHEFKS
ncbi:NAD-dependent epimerase/dehydratase family protein [Pelagicoccus mobilis]|uniref:NAD-dependent epimerase/dehydratase family protein n=1 Tax=Pelagicoccus mobilis TaxID=415221 RepID=A0A934VPC4_9BACT|nr:NAD-dependent epimerase/dehydratase family protein [Pelagicoccus mobilis]MBK1875675.1 NAD-dependent epimerase/dehydratase family protein [Pelagicoccus mobilis]